MSTIALDRDKRTPNDEALPKSVQPQLAILTFPRNIYGTHS
jgi:hypothetical protein